MSPIPAHPQKQKAIHRFTTLMDRDPRVAAAFLGGSFAAGTADEYSDLDLYVIVEDDAYDAVLADRRSFVGEMGNVILVEDFSGFGFDMVVFMLDDGIEGELAFGRRSSFAHIHRGPYEVLSDPDGVLDWFVFDLQTPSVERRKQSVERTLAWFWRELSLFSTAAVRGRPWTAYGHLESARREALDLAWWLEAPRSWPGGYDKIEDHVASELMITLEETFVDLDVSDQLLAAGVLADFIAGHGRTAARDVGSAYPEELEVVVRKKLGAARP